MAEPELSSIVLVSPYVPLRSINGVNPNFAPQNLELWNSTSPNAATPASIDFTSPSNFIVKFAVLDHTNYPNAILVGHCQPPGANSDAEYSMELFNFRTGYSAKDGYTTKKGFMIFTVQITPYLLKVPWGFNRKIKWTLSGDFPSSHSSYTELTLYAITGDIAPFWISEKIPVEFLDLFVFPTSKMDPGCKTLNDWITWVVKRCYASTTDTNYHKSNDGIPESECIHSYRYEIKNGGNQFVGNNETIFKLDQWLLNRATPGTLSTVNCYDQAALLQTALSLGVPYAFSSDGTKVVKSVGRIHKMAFGFMPPSYLVGWGWTNSPFLSPDKTVYTKEVIGRENGGIPHNRTLFKDHSWVYYRLKDTGEGNFRTDVAALDACAGPVVDPSEHGTLLNYLTNHIDVQATEDFDVNWWLKQDHRDQWEQYVKDRWLDWDNLEVKLYDGVVSTMPQPVLPQAPLERSHFKKELLDLLPDFWADMASAEKNPNTAKLIPAPAQDIIKNAIDALPKSHVYNPPIWYPKHIGVAGTEFRVDISAKDDDKFKATMTLKILTDWHDAITSAVTDLNVYSNDVSTLFDFDTMKSNYYDDLSYKKARVNLWPLESGRDAILVRNNIYFKIKTQEMKSDDIIKAVGAAQDSITDHIEDELLRVSPDRFRTVPSAVQSGQPFELQIFGDSTVAELSPLIFKNNYIFTKNDEVVKKDTDVWAIQCCAKLPDGQQGPATETLVVSFAAKKSYYTTNWSCNIEILG